MKPTGKAHVFASALLGAVVSYRLEFSPNHIFVGILGGLFPDTDMRQSILGRFIWMWLIFHPHRRNVLHSPVGAVISTGIILAFDPLSSYALVFLCGYISHLVLDMFNATGIPLFYPSKRMISVARIRTGGLGELMLLFIFYMMVMTLLSV